MEAKTRRRQTLALSVKRLSIIISPVNEKSLAVLEFPAILAWLERLTSFSPTRELVEALRPSANLAAVQRAQALTSEGRDLLELNSSFSLGGARDVRAAVQRASLGGVLDAEDLLEIESTLVSARTVRRAIDKHAASLPLLSDLARALSDCQSLSNEINVSIGQRGEVLDSASEALARIRRSVRGAHERLLNRFNEMLGNSTIRQALQEGIITQRDGRYVLPVKADFRGQIKGVVHDQSASGATLYIEPLATVELNNRWRELQMEESREVSRILRELSANVAGHTPELLANVVSLSKIDFCLAKARLANEMNAVEPQLRPAGAPVARAAASEPLLQFGQARHPLLRGDVVPIDIWLGPDFRVLVITGPNTGGKTVSLKTVGLLTLMAQAGLHLPVAEGSSAAVFQQVFADIGDEQSIEQSLSTFSAHMTNIVDILGKADSQSLVLLDELGAGTDPTEGSALARAILELLLARGSACIATTHYSELKAYAHLTEGVRNASVEFDVETLSPTYRLQVGLPGRSNALEIASRIGLPQDVIENARQMIDPRSAEVEQLLTRIQAEHQKTLADRERAAELREDARKLQNRLSAALREQDEQREQVLERAREQAELELQQLRQQLEELLAEALAGAKRQDAAALQRQLQTLEKTTERALTPRRRRRTVSPGATAEPEEPTPTAAGARVWVNSLAQVGELLTDLTDGGEAEVLVGSLKVRVSREQLEPVRGREGKRNPADAFTPVAVTADVAARETPSVELDLRGMRAEAALELVAKYVEDAYLAGLPFVRIIHGKGTGVLRQVVKDWLSRSRLVHSHHTAEQREGGEGATIAKLAV